MAFLVICIALVVLVGVPFMIWWRQVADDWAESEKQASTKTARPRTRPKPNQPPPTVIDLDKDT
ncbi:MAG: hypothetical protein KDA28_14580 [Phycisphaerales bacterium]|nr:hypothetical protein [Phycisphaerales bacterium]